MFGDSLWFWAAGGLAAWVFLGLAAGRFHAMRHRLVDANKAGPARRGG